MILIDIGGENLNNIFNSIARVFATKSPPSEAIPNQNFIWYDRTLRNQNKQVLSKPPTVQQLRNFAKNGIIRRPINLIKDTISRLDYELVNVNSGDKKKYIKQRKVISTIIENPNIIHTRKNFINMILEDLVVLDAGVFEKAYSPGSSRPLFLYPVDGSTIQFVVPYDYTDDNAARFAQQQTKDMKYFSSKQLAYLQRNYFTDRPQGLSPVLQAYNYIQYFLSANKRANGVAGNATADFLISLGSQVNENQRSAFQDYFTEEIEGTGKIPIVNGSDNIDTKQIRAISKDGLYQEWQQFLMTIIAVSFGLPPQKIGVLVSNDKSTADDLDKVIMDELVKPYADIIEDAINEHVLKPLGFNQLFRFQFIYEESQKDKTAKSTRINNEYLAGYITTNEAREKAGYERMESEYCDMIGDERKAKINAEFNGGGFNGVGDEKDNYKDKSPQGGDSK